MTPRSHSTLKRAANINVDTRTKYFDTPSNPPSLPLHLHLIRIIVTVNEHILYISTADRVVLRTYMKKKTGEYLSFQR